MKNLVKLFAIIVLSGCIYWVCTSLSTSADKDNAAVFPTRQTWLPQDPYPSCVLNQDSFNSWFASHKATENGLVLPAKSVAFQPDSNCSFYQRAEHMFMWVASPTSGMYKPGSTVMESSLFYDVSPEDSTFQRSLIPHTSNHVFNMSSHLLKNGPNRLPAVKDRAGRLFEIERNERPMSHLGLGSVYRMEM